MKSDIDHGYTVVDVSLASSQLQIPFSTAPGALTIIQCGQATR